MSDPAAACSRLKTAIAERCQEIVANTERWLEDHSDFVKSRLPRGVYDPKKGPNPRKLRYGFAPAEEREYLPILTQGTVEGNMHGRACDSRDQDIDTTVDTTGAYGCELPGQELQGGYDTFSYELKGKAFETGYACALDLLLKESYNDYLDGLAKAIKREAVKHHCWGLERDVINLATYNTAVVDGYTHSEGAFPTVPTGGLNFETIERTFALLHAEGWTGAQVVGGVSREAFEFMVRQYRDQKGYNIDTTPSSSETEFIERGMDAKTFNGVTFVFSKFPTRGYLRSDPDGGQELHMVRPTVSRAGTGGGIVPAINQAYYDCRYYCDGAYEELYEAAFIIHPEFAKVLSFQMPNVAGKSWSRELFNLNLRMIDGDTVTNRFGVANTDNFKFFMRALHAYSFEPENPELASVVLYRVSPHSPTSVTPVCNDAFPGTPSIPEGGAEPQLDDGQRDCSDPNDPSCGGEVKFPVYPEPTEETPCPAAGGTGTLKWVDCGGITTGYDVGTLRVCVERVGGVTGAASIQLDTANGTASAGTDYTAIVAGAATWADGEGGYKCFDIEIDPTGSAGGTFTANLTLNVGAGLDLDCDNLTVTIEAA